MRRFPLLLTALPLALTLMGWSPFSGSNSIPWTPVQWTDAGTTFGPYPGDAGAFPLDGGVGPFASQPFVARTSGASVHQTVVCAGSVLAAPSTVNASIQPQGSNDLGTWQAVGTPCVIAIDAGTTIVGSCGFDETSGYPFQRLLITNSGSDAGTLACTVAAF